MQFLVTLVQLSFLLRVIWQNVEGLAKKPTSSTLDTIWEVTGTKLPVLPVPPGHPVSKQNADVEAQGAAHVRLAGTKKGKTPRTGHMIIRGYTLNEF